MEFCSCQRNREDFQEAICGYDQTLTRFLAMGGLSITALLLWPAVTSPPPITDIAVCFTVMASVITARFLEKTQHMLQYLAQ